MRCGKEPRRNHLDLAPTIHEYLLCRPILSPGGAFLVRPPRRTASTPTSALLAKSPGGLRSRTPRDGIHEQSGLDRPRITNDAYPTIGYSHTYAEASRVLRFRAREFRTTVLKREMEMLGEIRCTPAWRNNSNVPRTCPRTSRIMRVREEQNTGGVYP